MSPWVSGPDGTPVVKGPQAAKHHWWPGGLSKFWKGDDGKVGAVRSDGTTFRSHHRKLGAIRDGHTYLHGEHRDSSPWNQSEESTFDIVDDALPTIVTTIQSLSAQVKKDVEDTWTEMPDNEWLRNTLGPALLSLCLRCPRSRFIASSMGRNMLGYERGSEVDKNVALGNILAAFRTNARSIQGRGKVGVVRALEGEFIYGDGIYHNIIIQGDLFSNRKMFVPLTPSLAVGYFTPSSYTTEPMFNLMNIRSEKVEQLNELVQIYSESELFYSDEMPTISPHFTRSEFGQVTEQSNLAAWLLNTLPGVK